jgi:hypothetical protein
LLLAIQRIRNLSVHQENNENDKTRTCIIRKIGARGMGEVYLPEDTKLKRKVALKFLQLYLRQDEYCRARFKHKAWATAVTDTASPAIGLGESLSG